ncbi:hypothetical protein IDM40_11285 [Nocardiopsis sp. HNM0947]|uniref:Lipoprotein n=1 Tax=Nocardiopsis coralli TaxID=2772213 RepID=A0ABR9P635_9ACTN|nr:hypothetical protein [Nocardiopsis coralli]MBE2999284.1 hypothetical protein [Nocardiopsis coralli]
MPGPPSRAPLARISRPLVSTACLTTCLLLAAALLAACSEQDGDPDEEALTEEEAAAEEEPQLAIETDPEDAAAVAQEAVELALEAESFESLYFMDGPELGDAPAYEFLYTEDPEPRYRETNRGGPALVEVIEVGEGPDDVIRNSRMQNPGEEDSFYRDPEDADPDTGREEWERLLRLIPETVEESGEVTREGIGRAGMHDDVGTGAPLLQDNPVTEELGHLYTGNLPFSDEEWQPGDVRRFHLWIAEDGYPQLLYLHESTTRGSADFQSYLDEFLLFEQFNDPVQVEIPDESEIGGEQPGSAD